MKNIFKRGISIMLVLLMIVMMVPTTASAAVKISKEKATMEVDSTLKLKISGSKSKITWKTSKKAIVTVNDTGTITAKSEGQATITATVGNTKYTCTVTVVDSNKTSKSSEETPALTMGQKNALDKAKSYLKYSAFSYIGLVDQLEYEGFSNKDATYAVDNCGADWNEQAAKKAKQYLDYSSFSRSGLVDQLLYEGFTNEQAEYGVTAVGY